MSQKKQFRYGEDDETEAFIANATNAPRKNGTYEPMDVSMNFGPREGWTSEVYQQIDGGERRDPKHGCLSCSVLVYAILLAFGGIALIIVSYLQSKLHLLPLCPDCDAVQLGLYVAGGVVLAIGILGIASAVARIKCLAIPFTIIIVLIGLAFLAIGVVCIIWRSSLDTIDLLPLWTSTLHSSPDFLCDVQSQLTCSGFSDGCCVTNYTSVDLSDALLNASYCYLTMGNGVYWSSSTLTAVTWPTDVCDFSCNSNNYTTMCDVQIRSKISSNFIPIVASIMPFGLISVVIGVFAICMTRRTGLAR